MCAPGADMVIKVALRLQGFTDEDSMEEQFSPFVRSFPERLNMDFKYNVFK